MSDAPGLDDTDMVKNEPVKSRQVHPTRRHIFDLPKKHPLVILIVGDLEHSIQRTNANHQFGKILMETIQNLVNTMNAAKRLSHQALAADILCHGLVSKFGFDFVCCPRTNFHNFAVRYDGGRVYQQNLLKMIITSSNQFNDVDDLLNELTSVETGSTAFSRNPAKLAFRLLMDGFEEDGNAYQNMQQKFGKRPLTRVCELLCQVLDQDLDSRSKGRNPLLEEKV